MPTRFSRAFFFLLDGARIDLFREYLGKDGYTEQVPMELEVSTQPDEGVVPSWTSPESTKGSDTRALFARWDLPLDRKALEAEDGGIVALYVEEIEWRRPAQYPVEPVTRKQLDDHDIFLESGPRFAARLDLSVAHAMFLQCCSAAGGDKDLRQAEFGCPNFVPASVEEGIAGEASDARYQGNRCWTQTPARGPASGTSGTG